MPLDAILDNPSKIGQDWAMTYRIPKADLDKVREACLKVTKSLECSGVGAQMIRANVELVLAEILTNIVKHGYMRGHGAIVIKAAKSGDCLDFLVADRGVQMPGLALPVGQQPNVSSPIEDLPEGGFGWFLIHALTEDLSYSRNGKRNVLRFSFAL